MTASSLSSLGDLLETELRDRYTIERELGAGGMARVWIATDVRQNRTVALKDAWVRIEEVEKSGRGASART